MATAMLFHAPGVPHESRTLPTDSLGTELRAGEVLVRIDFATVCGSDVHTVLGHRTEPAPLVLGHEAVGHVVAVGEADDTGTPDARYSDGRIVAVGDRVVWSVAVHCGHCPRCLRDLPQKCQSLKKYGHERGSEQWRLTGGFATHIQLLPGSSLVRVSEELPDRVLAPASCGIATAWAALAAAERSVPLQDARVLITGGGLIGLAATAMAASRGARVTLSDPAGPRRDRALQFRASEVHDPARDDSIEASYDIAIEASGAPSAVQAGLNALDIGGTAVWVGSVFPTPGIDVVPERVVRSLITITGVHNYTPHELAGAVEFLHEHGQRYPFAELVGDSYPLTDLDRALTRAAQHREVRVGVEPSTDPRACATRRATSSDSE